MAGRRQPTPRIVLAYGLLGVLPFLAPSVTGALLPTSKSVAAQFLVLYGGLILSFLGGARWGLAVSCTDPPARIITLAMVPTLAGLALLTLPPDDRQVQLLGLAAALGLHWLWDVTGSNLPDWYPVLRSVLTGGALVGLIAGAVVLT